MTLSIIAIVISAIAIGVSFWNARSDSRSAAAAEDSAVTSRQAAEHARESAEHAKASADAAERMVQAEVERDHRDLRPLEPDVESATVYAVNPQSKTKDRFFEFVPPRTYRVAGDMLKGEGRSRIGLPLVVEAGKPVRFYLDRPGEVPVEAVHIRFWPPVDVDPGERWRCECNRPQVEGGEVHWEWFIKLPSPKWIQGSLTT